MTDIEWPLLPEIERLVCNLLDSSSLLNYLATSKIVRRRCDVREFWTVYLSKDIRMNFVVGVLLRTSPDCMELFESLDIILNNNVKERVLFHYYLLRHCKNLPQNVFFEQVADHRFCTQINDSAEAKVNEYIKGLNAILSLTSDHHQFYLPVERKKQVHHALIVFCGHIVARRVFTPTIEEFVNAGGSDLHMLEEELIGDVLSATLALDLSCIPILLETIHSKKELRSGFKRVLDAVVRQMAFLWQPFGVTMFSVFLTYYRQRPHPIRSFVFQRISLAVPLSLLTYYKSSFNLFQISSDEPPLRKDRIEATITSLQHTRQEIGQVLGVIYKNSVEGLVNTVSKIIGPKKVDNLLLIVYTLISLTIEKSNKTAERFFKEAKCRGWI